MCIYAHKQVIIMCACCAHAVHMLCACCAPAVHACDLGGHPGARRRALSYEEDWAGTGQSAASLSWGKDVGVWDHKLCAYRTRQGPMAYVHTNMCATPTMCVYAHEHVIMLCACCAHAVHMLRTCCAHAVRLRAHVCAHAAHAVRMLCACYAHATRMLCACVCILFACCACAFMHMSM